MEDKQSVTVTFAKELVAWIDEEAEKNFRSRSAHMEYILMELKKEKALPKKTNGSK